MKTSKECTTCSHFTEDIKDGYYIYPCTVCISKQDIVGFAKWEPIETKKPKQNKYLTILRNRRSKKMKNETPKRIIEVLKEMFTFSDSVNLFAARFTIVAILIFANYDVIKSSDLRFILIFNAVIVGIWLLGYFSRKPDPNRKGFKKWLKICILKLRMLPKQFYLLWYPDLKKYRGKPNLRQKVWAKRDKLKELERELKELT